jgi:hypothetical protein
VDGIPAVSIRISGYFFIIFLSEFEVNSTYVSCIYDYIEDAVGGILSQIRYMKEISSDTQIKAACNSFGKKIKNYFGDKIIYGRNAKEFILGDNYIRRHRVEDVLKMLERVSKSSPIGNKCNVFLKEHRCTKNFYIRCSSRELGAVLSMMMFSCIICSYSKKPNIEISFLNYRGDEVGEITFSVKSKEKDKELNKIIDSKEYVDERSLYFKAIKTLAFKNLWAFRVYKISDKLCFSLSIVGDRTTGLVFNDVDLDSTAVCENYFEMFMNSVLFKDEVEESIE